jgi:hypothetical protein
MGFLNRLGGVFPQVRLAGVVRLSDVLRRMFVGFGAIVSSRRVLAGRESHT